MACPTEPLQGSQQLRLKLAAESSKVLKRFDAWKEEVGTAFSLVNAGLGPAGVDRGARSRINWALRTAKISRVFGT